MVNYKNGKIYKLVSANSDKVYYGSTTQRLCTRKAKHFNHYKNHMAGKYKAYLRAFDVIKDGDVSIVLVENYPCDDNTQLHERERYYIENNICVNKQIPNRSNADYRRDNKEAIKQINKQYYANNKEKFKKYKQNNSDKIKQYNKKYNEDNKAKLSKKHLCECGVTYSHVNKSHHERSIGHHKHLESLADQ